MRMSCRHNPVLEVEDLYLRVGRRSKDDAYDFYSYIGMGRSGPVRDFDQLAKNVVSYLLTK